MTEYYRPLLQTGPLKPPKSVVLAGAWCWFDRVERIRRDGENDVVPVDNVPRDVLDRLTRGRASVAGLSMMSPQLMGILNVTPDSFSDGGLFIKADRAVAHAQAMINDGADLLDIGGESTRPGAELVPDDVEIQRVAPVIATLRKNTKIPISVDTRKSGVASAALDAGATIINDVSALSFDPQLSEVASKRDIPVCLMHAQGDPETMQENPDYKNVLLEVYDYLSARIDVAVAAGIERHNIVVDPGIGFGKTLDHNLTLLKGIALFHGLGCPILLGASRKRFIGTLAQTDVPEKRVFGSVAVTLAAMAQGVQIHRVHDIKEHRQAMALWSAVTV